MFENAPKSYKDPFWTNLASEAEQEYNLPKGLLRDILLKGEKSNADQVSSAGARTPFQIIEPTRQGIQKNYGFDPYSTPKNSARGAAALLRESLDRNKGSVRKAVQEYHGGLDPKGYGPINAAYVNRVVGDMEPKQDDQVSELVRMYRERMGGKQPAQAAQPQAEPADSGVNELVRAYKERMAAKQPAAQGNVLPEVVVTPDAAQVMQQPPSTAESIFQGAVIDPVSGGAQLLTKALPDSVVNAGNRFNNFLAEKTGLVAPIPEGGVDQLIKSQQDEYAQRQGDNFDMAKLAGAVISPLNFVAGAGALSAINKLQQGGRVAQGLAKTVPAIAGGAASAVSAPVTEGDYTTGLLQQTGLGALGGQAGAMIGGKVATMLANRKAKAGAQAMSIPQIKQLLESEAIKEMGSLPVGFDSDGLAVQVQNALRQGKATDPRAIVRQGMGERVLGAEAQLTSGQISRDPQEWAREFNLSQIEGVGKPIADRLNAQEKQLINALTSTGSLIDPYDAGTIAGKSLKNLDETLSNQVRDKYTKFRQSGGAKVDVNLAPVQQALGNVLETYGPENLPSAVKNRLESYVTGEGKQGRVFDLLEADRLLKIINANYDPKNKAQAGALGEIKAALNQSIDELADGDANTLLRDAVSTAKKRFQLHNELPALRDAAFNDLASQEKFVQRYVTGSSASIDQVGKLVQNLDTEGINAVRGAVLRDIVAKAAPGAELGTDAAKISPAALRKVLNSIGDRKLSAIFGPQTVQKLRDVQYVADLVKNQPAGAVPNRSGTAAGVANLVQQKVFNLPFINIGRDTFQNFQRGNTVSSALMSKTPTRPVTATPMQLQGLRGLGAAFGIPAGAAAIQSLDD